MYPSSVRLKINLRKYSWPTEHLYKLLLVWWSIWQVWLRQRTSTMIRIGSGKTWIKLINRTHNLTLTYWHMPCCYITSPVLKPSIFCSNIQTKVSRLKTLAWMFDKTSVSATINIIISGIEHSICSSKSNYNITPVYYLDSYFLLSLTSSHMMSMLVTFSNYR